MSGFLEVTQNDYPFKQQRMRNPEYVPLYGILIYRGIKSCKPVLQLLDDKTNGLADRETDFLFGVLVVGE